jgi:hypothetical protein
MTHDPLCGLSQPCDDEIPEHGYCSMQHGQFCIHCHQWCICKELQMAEERMLAKCIAAVWACGDDKGYIYSDIETGIEWATAALRDLKEKP